MSVTSTGSDHHLFPEPTKSVGPKYVIAMFTAQFVFFVALLGPAIVGVAVKINSFVPEAERNSAIGTVMGVGALGAAIANIIFGRLSDRTTSSWGRRRPWIVGGTIVMTAAFALLAMGQSVGMVTLGWFIAQIGANATLAAFLATMSDQIPERQRGSLAAILGIAQNVGILGGTIVAEQFADNLMVMFVGPAVLAILAMAAFAFVLPDQVLPAKPPAMSLAEWGRTFWVSPAKHPDFAYAWLSRFLIVLGTFMFTTFRLNFLIDSLDITQERALSAVTLGVTFYTVALVLSGWIAGKLSDVTGKRKIFVGTSTALFAIGTGMLTQVSSLGGFYLVEVILGLAYGVYMGVDLALVVDVLPNPDDAAKDLGVFNLANAVPQTLAPLVAASLLGVSSATGQNYDLMLYSAAGLTLIGAFVIIPIKSVK